MNWYKAAEERTAHVTPAEFGAMSLQQKQDLVTPTLTKYVDQELQRLFFTESYMGKHYALWNLSQNRSITPETQRLFFTEKYMSKDWVLTYLAGNTSITPATQRLFFAWDYEGKSEALWFLAKNEKFLRNFTREELLLIKGVVKGSLKLQILSKRLKQIAGAP